MKHIFNTFAFLAAALACLAFTACSKDDDSKSNDNGLEGTWVYSKTYNYTKGATDKATKDNSDLVSSTESSFVRFKNGVLTVMEVEIRRTESNGHIYERHEFEIERANYTVSGDVIKCSNFRETTGSDEDVNNWRSKEGDAILHYTLSNGYLKIAENSGTLYSKTTDSELDKYLLMFSLE